MATYAPFTLDEDAIAVERDNGKMTKLLVVAVSLLSFVISLQAFWQIKMYFFRGH